MVVEDLFESIVSVLVDIEKEMTDRLDIGFGASECLRSERIHGDVDVGPVLIGCNKSRVKAVRASLCHG